MGKPFWCAACRYYHSQKSTLRNDERSEFYFPARR
nr:MAG TPA: Kruppel-like factor 3 finger, kruppel-like, DNA BINDING [Caudoviricetes sp.]